MTLEEGAIVDLREGATVDLREGATVDLRRRCNRGPKKKVQPWTLQEGATVVF